MKRFLGVLLVLLMVVPAFAVTGEVFTKIKGGDVSTGDTGFSLNFDSFNVKYTFVGAQTYNQTWNGWLNNPLDARIGGFVASLYSPGKIEITGFKVGMLNLGAALTVRFGSDRSKILQTNTAGATNNWTDVESTGWGIDVLPKVALVVGSINASTSDQMEFLYQTITTESRGLTATNNINVTEAKIKLGVNVKYQLGEVGGYYEMYSLTKKETTPTTTKFSQRRDDYINTWGDVTLKLNDSMDLYGKMWFRYAFFPEDYGGDGHADILTVNDATLTNRYGWCMRVGPEVKLIYKIAGGQVKLNLGAGIVYSEVKRIVLAGTATNQDTTRTWIALFGVKRDEHRALMEFGGSSKMGNWEVGIGARLSSGTLLSYKEVGTGPWYSGGTDVKTETKAGTGSAPWGEKLFTATVNSLYLKYSVGMVSVKFNLREDLNDQGVAGTVGGLGTGAAQLFSSVELSYKF